MIREKIKRKIRKKAGRCFELTIICLAGFLVCFGDMFTKDEETNGFS